MRLFQPSQDRDIERLSAYLDDELSPADRAKLEHRLQTDSRLRATLAELQRVQTSLADLPTVKPPRNFTLTSQMAGQPARPPSRLIPTLNWATTLAAVLFAALIGSELFTQYRPPAIQSESVAAQAPAPDTFAVEVPAGDQGAEAQLKSTTETPAAVMESAPAIAAVTESPAESLTSSSEPGSGGGADAGAPAMTEESVSNAADTVTGTPDVGSTLRSVATEQPVAESQAPTETPLPVESPMAAQSQPESQALTFSPLRLAQLAAAVILLSLLALSFLIRRR